MQADILGVELGQLEKLRDQPRQMRAVPQRNLQVLPALLLRKLIFLEQ